MALLVQSIQNWIKYLYYLSSSQSIFAYWVFCGMLYGIDLPPFAIYCSSLQFALILLWYLIKMFISFIWLLLYSRHKILYVSTNN